MLRALSLLPLLFAQSAAAAEPPVFRETERFVTGAERHGGHRAIGTVGPLVVVPRKPCCTGYVGSAYGLAKPNYYGISPRPDDGFPDPLR